MLIIYEFLVRNVGIIGGKFFERIRVIKLGLFVDNFDFYIFVDFQIGVLIQIFKYRFRIIDVDEYVLKYLEFYVRVYFIVIINFIREKYGRLYTIIEELLVNVL